MEVNTDDHVSGTPPLLLCVLTIGHDVRGVIPWLRSLPGQDEKWLLHRRMDITPDFLWEGPLGLWDQGPADPSPLLSFPLLPSPPTGVLRLGPIRGQQPGVLHDAGQDLSSELVGVAGGDAGPGVIEMRTWNSWQLELGDAQAAWAGVSSPLPPALTSSSPLSSCPVRNKSRLQRSWCC